MSVAFRREGDDEHLEPRFELPIPAGPNLVTLRGFRLIDARLNALEIALRTADDDERKTIARDLRYWRTRRATARIAEPPPKGVVGLGRQVRLRRNGDEILVRIVGHDEADPTTQRIGFAAPLARALIGAMAGDVLPFAGREDALEIIAVDDIVDEEPT